MNLYYVYKVPSKDEKVRQFAFVDNPEEFARLAFDPNIMEYTGVAIEAESIPEAAVKYEKPGGNVDDYFMADEPRPTVLKRQAYEARKRLGVAKENLFADLDKLLIQAMGKQVALSLNNVNKLLSEMARRVRTSDGKKPTLSPDLIYDSLKKRILDKLKDDYEYQEPDE